METEETELSKIDKLKKHVKENKKFYIGTATGFVVGAISATAFILLRYGSTETEDKALASIDVKTLAVLSKVNNNTFQTISQYGNIIGRPGKPVFNTITGKRFESETLAAESVGSTVSMMSRHLNEHKDHVNGQTFRFVTDAE